MPYLPESYPVATAASFEESELYPPLQTFDELRKFLAPVLGSRDNPMIHGESYDRLDGATLFVATSDVPLDAQKAANILQRPLGDQAPWRAVQAGLRSVGFERRRIMRAMKHAGRLPDLREVSASAHRLAQVMNHTSQVRTTRANVEVLSLSESHRVADQNLRLLPVQELAHLISVVLRRDMSAERLRQLKNWLRATRKRPGDTPEFQDFFSQLQAEMEAEGYVVDGNDEIVSNLPYGDYQSLKDALWQVIFERFTIYDEPDGDSLGMSGYIRSDEVPRGVDREKETTIDLGQLGVDLFLQFGGIRGEVIFRSPPRGWEIRPALVWERDDEGVRRLKFESTLYRRDPETDNVVHHSPLVGASALALHFGEKGRYVAALDRLNPYVRQPRRDVPGIARAGLLPLVLADGQEDLFMTPYMARLESKIEGAL